MCEYLNVCCLRVTLCVLVFVCVCFCVFFSSLRGIFRRLDVFWGIFYVCICVFVGVCVCMFVSTFVCFLSFSEGWTED